VRAAGAVHFEVVEVGVDEDTGDGEVGAFVAFPSVDLEEEAFLEVAGADADGFEAQLEDGDGVFDVFGGEASGEMLGDGFDGVADVAVVADPVDDDISGAADAVFDLDHVPLAGEFFLEGDGAGGSVGHGVHFGVAFAVGAGTGATVELRPIGLVLDILFNFTVGDVGLLLVFGGLGGFGGSADFLGHACDGGEVGGFVIRFFAFEDGIGDELLLDALFKGHEGELEDLHGLNHAGGQLHPLFHPHVL
jgi:hypothetical protein